MRVEKDITMTELYGPAPKKRHGTIRFMILLVSSLLIGIGVLTLLFVLLWEVPKWQVAGIEEPKDRLAAESAFRQTLVQLVGGTALLFGLYFTAQTLRTSQKTLQVNQETLLTTQQGQITVRFGNAIEHLGDKERLTVRLGGIYALERIARDSPKDHWQIMEVLTAYVRDNAPWPPKTTQLSQDGSVVEGKQAGKEDQSIPKRLATDIQAVLTVLGRRIRSSDQIGENLTLSHTDLRNANLSNAHLQGANLWGVHLEGANLLAAHLEKAMLWDAHLERALLTNAHLRGARLMSARLEGATLIGAHLEGAFLTNANLEGATLIGAHLEGANLIDAKNLTQDQIDTACVDQYTELPEDLTRPTLCSKSP